MEYTVVIKDQASPLIYEVDRLLALGWEPLGGVCVVMCINGTFRFIQALVKKAG